MVGLAQKCNRRCNGVPSISVTSWVRLGNRFLLCNRQRSGNGLLGCSPIDSWSKISLRSDLVKIFGDRSRVDPYDRVTSVTDVTDVTESNGFGDKPHGSHPRGSFRWGIAW